MLHQYLIEKIGENIFTKFIECIYEEYPDKNQEGVYRFLIGGQYRRPPSPLQKRNLKKKGGEITWQ
jgi:hypothetical protein